MPVKRRRAKGRVGLADEMHAWEMVFKCGWDFFREAEKLTRSRGALGQWTDRPEAREAWDRIGADFLAAYGDERARWALETFGRPPLPGPARLSTI